MKKVLTGATPIKLKRRVDVPLYLCASIMSQQLSTKVATVLYQRFLNLYDGHTPTPAQVLATAPETLRGIGLSTAKANYVLNVCRFSEEQGMDWKKLRKMDDEAIIRYLIQIKGVGRWTVEMLLMFALQREDVFSVDDLGIQLAMKRLYKIEAVNKKALRIEMERIANKWIPYRTYACLHLWQWKDKE